MSKIKFNLDPTNKTHSSVTGIYFIKNYITNSNIEIGNYTYYHGETEQEAIEFQNKNILYHFPFIGDKITIGKFCSIGAKTRFIMNGANHNYQCLSTYPFYLFSNDSTVKKIGTKHQVKKGNLIIGNDVWIGYGATILPGIVVGHGAVIGAKSVVTKDVPPYAIIGGNPAKIIKYRFSPAKITELLVLQWWDWEISKITDNLTQLCTKVTEEF